jgi:hypothetical protein
MAMLVLESSIFCPLYLEIFKQIYTLAIFTTSINASFHQGEDLPSSRTFKPHSKLKFIEQETN